MNDSFHRAVLDALDYLITLQRDAVPPPDARGQLQSLRSGHPELQLDLLAEVQAFDQSAHYDVLVRQSGEGTVSISYCPEQTLPWPLRGVQRWSEAELVRVNDSVLQVEGAMACLDFIWDQAPVLEKMVNLCLIHEELDRDPIELDDAQLQEAMNRFRAAKKLYKAEDTIRWLERHGMSQHKLEEYVAETAIVPMLRQRIAAGHVDEYFREHRSDFDAVQVVQLHVADERQAQELAEQIRCGAQDVFEAAQRMHFEAESSGMSPTTSLFATMRRREVEPALREVLFSAKSGELVGPVPFGTGYAVVRVVAITRASLDEATRNVVTEVLFEQWLEQRRRTAQIEWFWGNASKTEPVT